MGFDRNNEVWITRISSADDFITSKYKFLNTSGALKMDIVKSEDNKLEGNYDVSIDTIEDMGEQYIIRLKLDGKNTYIEAIRPRIKYQ